MIANYLQTNVSVNCLQKVSMSCVGELSPKTVSMSCLVDELSRFLFLEIGLRDIVKTAYFTPRHILHDICILKSGSKSQSGRCL